MKTQPTYFRKDNTRLFAILAGTTALFLIPVFLQLTIGSGIDGQGFNWKTDDFIVMAILLYATAFLCEFVLRKVKNRRTRIMICVAVLLLFVLIWADLAVGIFNIPGFSGS